MDTDFAVWRRALRARLTSEREALDDGAYQQAANAITIRLIEYLSPFGIRILGFYWSHRREYDPSPVALKMLGEGGEAALPVIVAKGQPLEFRLWHPDIEMMVGLYEIPHPAGGPVVTPDTILVPMVGFDGAGYRLGYGGGYYDRTLAALPAYVRKIGVGFEQGRLATVDPQPHDIRMHAIVTEDGVFETPG